MIRAIKLGLAPGGNRLLNDVDWHLRPGQRIGLVGRNGTGKSTLLHTLAGDRSPDYGEVQRRGKIRVGLLPQKAVSGSTDTVWNEVRQHMHRLKALRAELEAAEAAVENNRPGAVERLALASEAFQIGGGFSEDETVGTVLHGLGFPAEDWSRSCDTFSGGWQMRIALARLLLSEPDVAMLDEPTNHLDLHARIWLANYLSSVPWTVVVVSHDRYLLDRCVTQLTEVRAKKLHHYPGNFAQFLAQREQREVAAQGAHNKQQAERAKLERFVERFKAKATKAAQARSRQKRLDKMEIVEQPLSAIRLPKFNLPSPPPSAEEVFVLSGVSVGFDEPLVSDLDLVIRRGMKLAILGPNGAGKSTLLHGISGRMPLMAGKRRVGDRVRVGVFTQDLAAELPGELSGLELLSGQAPAVKPVRLRSILGALGLPGDMALRKIEQLSGGEKARVALAALAALPYNVLLLDEPTNHLDIETVEVLVQALRSWEGAIVVVSHDRYLVESIATHVLHIHQGESFFKEGIDASDFDPVRATRITKREVVASGGSDDYAKRKQKNREVERAKRRISTIEDEVTALEATIEQVDDQLIEFATDYARSSKLSAERDSHQSKVDGLYEEWELLEELVAGA